MGRALFPIKKEHFEKMKKALLPLIAVLSCSLPAFAEQTDLSDQKNISVTVYNQNLALVKDVRTVKLRSGSLDLRFKDVASNIDPTSVSFKSLSDPKAFSILEQNYEYDLITPERLMEKYLNKEVDLLQPSGIQRATLLSSNEGYVYKIGERIHLQPPGQVILPKLPENLVSRPTLVWTLDNRKAMDHTVEASYLTGGLEWSVNYVLLADKDDRQVDLTGWVTLNNNSGAEYRNADLTLVAGDVHRAQRQSPLPMAAKTRMDSSSGGGFQEAPLFEYHSYHLARPATLKDRQIKQLTLLDAKGVPVVKRFFFQPNSYPVWYQSSERQKAKVSVSLEFPNSKAANLGMPLPKGLMRVYQADASNQLQFVGEDAIDHTPRDERVRIKLGEAFDLVGERWQTNFKRLGEHSSEASYKISLRNHKNVPVTVNAVEKLGGDWDIVEKSQDFTKTDSNTVEFKVDLPSGQERTLSYTVRTTY